MAKLVNKSNIENLGNSPQDFMDEVEKMQWEANQEKLHAEILDENFRTAKAAEDSRYLTRVSSYIVAAWDILKIFAQRKDGEVIVVDYDGNIYKGRISAERLGKMSKLPGKMPKRIYSNWDDADVTYNSFVSKSVVEPANMTSGFKSEWDTAIKKAAKVQQIPLLDMFIRIYRTKGENVKIHHNIVTNAFGEIKDTFWMDGIDLKFTVNNRGTVLEYSYKGKVTKL
jgi:hypothetical protein